MTTEVEAADQLLTHEAVIERGLGSFLEVGAALIAIRDGKLYLATHSTFEAYCSARWQLSRPHAYRLIGAAETVAALSPMGDIPVPTSERQARELAGLTPEVAADVMAKAAEDGPPTAAGIAAARDEIAPRVKVTDTTTSKSEFFVDPVSGEIVDPPENFPGATKVSPAVPPLPSWKQNLRVQREQKDREKAIARAIEQFPELQYYVDKGEPEKAVSQAAQLRTYTGAELDTRRATAARAIELHKQGVFDRIAEAVDHLTPAQDVFFALNTASQALPADAADLIAAALAHGADPTLVDTWRQQFTHLAQLCSDLAAACQPRLRSVR